MPGMLAPLDLEIRQVDVLALVAVVLLDPDESFLELDRFESCDVFLVMSHDVWRRRGSSNRSGIPQ